MVASAFSRARLEDGKVSHGEGHAIMNLCMAATYDPDPRAPLGFRLPFNLESGEVLPVRWKRWLANDPINLVDKYKAALKSLRGIYIDCGWRDQYHIHYGTRILSKRLAQAGVRHTYEEFDDNHSDIDYRMDVSLPFLYRALKYVIFHSTTRTSRRQARSVFGVATHGFLSRRLLQYGSGGSGHARRLRADDGTLSPILPRSG